MGLTDEEYNLYIAHGGLAPADTFGDAAMAAALAEEDSRGDGADYELDAALAASMAEGGRAVPGDEAAARALQAALDAEAGVDRVAERVHCMNLADADLIAQQQFIELLTPHKIEIRRIAAAMAVYTDNADVYGFSDNFVVPNRDAILRICTALNLRTNYTVAEIQAGLTQHIAPEGFPNFIAGMVQLQGYIAGTPVETRTALNAAHTASMVYDLFLRVNAGHMEHNHQIPGGRVDLAGYLAYSFAECKNNGGGCYLGYAGRLFRDLVMLLSYL